MSYRGEVSRAILAAAGAILARGGPLTYAAIVGETGLTTDQVRDNIYQLRYRHKWPHEVVPEPRAKAVRRRRQARPPCEREEAVLEAARSLVGPDGGVDHHALAIACGFAARPWVLSLRRRGLWPYWSATRGPAASHVAPDGPEGRRAEVDREALGRMGDGRAERDDPLVLRGRPPANGSPARSRPPAPPPAREQVRAIVREWKLRTGRAVAAPRPPREKCVHHRGRGDGSADRPYEPRIYHVGNGR